MEEIISLKIAFWSEEDGCGTTSSMAAIASMCSNVWGMKTILMQSRNQEGDLYKKLEGIPYSSKVREESAYYALGGLDYLLWQEEHRQLDAAMMLNSMVAVVKERMYYLPQGEHKKRNVYANTLKDAMAQILRLSEYLSDLTFIDCGSGPDELSEYLLAQADAVVINLSQERQALDAYFQSRHAFCNNVVYLVNRYCQESVYNIQNLNRIYRLQGNLAVIPHNPFFRYASDKGKLEPFIRRHIRGSMLDCQFYFMKELMRSSHMILKAAGFAE